MFITIFHSSSFALAAATHYTFCNTTQDFTNALRLTPDFAEAHFWRGRVLFDLQVPGFLFGEGFFREIKDVTEAIRLIPNNGRNFRECGLVHLAAGNYDSSIADFAEAVWLNSGLAV